MIQHLFALNKNDYFENILRGVMMNHWILWILGFSHVFAEFSDKAIGPDRGSPASVTTPPRRAARTGRVP